MFAAGIESFFIFLLIAGATALFNWIKKRRESQDDWGEIKTPPAPVRAREWRETQPPPRASLPPKTSTNWEEELHKMLEGTVPRTPPMRPPPQRRAPPAKPVNIEPEPPSQPSMSVPEIFQREKFYKAHCNHCDGHIEFPASAMEQVISCPHCARPTVLRPFTQTRVEELAHRKVLAEFTRSTQKYEEASNLSQRVAAHMQTVSHQPAPLTFTEKKKPWREVSQVLAQFHDARSIRQAMLASLILGPPKALEN